MIADHYEKSAVIERLAAVTGNKKAFAAHIPAYPCLIQPLSDQVSEDMTGSFGKDFLMLGELADIAEGDRVTIDTEEYRVMATEAFNFGNNPHRETRLRIFKSS